MKKIILLRHAKSTWDYWGIDDIDRPLSQKGIERSINLGVFFLQKSISIDCVYSSSAIRAASTALSITRKMGLDSGLISLKEELYHSDVSFLFEFISKIDNKYDDVLLIAHNPGIENFVNNYFPSTEIVTAAGIMLTLNIQSWDDFSSETQPNYKEVINPKNIKFLI